MVDVTAMLFILHLPSCDLFLVNKGYLFDPMKTSCHKFSEDLNPVVAKVDHDDLSWYSNSRLNLAAFFVLWLGGGHFPADDTETSRVNEASRASQKGPSSETQKESYRKLKSMNRNVQKCKVTHCALLIIDLSGQKTWDSSKCKNIASFLRDLF